MYENIVEYKTRKYIYAIIFNFYENDYSEDISAFDLVIVESLKNIVEYLTSENYLSESVKNNISNYLIQAREINDKDRKKRIEFINDIVGFMNAQKRDESIIFYRLELHKRRRDFGYITLKYSDNKVKQEIENVHDSIIHDFYVLATHSIEISEEEFKEEYLPYFKDTNIYYESLNTILYENPLVFKDELFYNRMMQVLNLNNELYQDKKDVLNMTNKLIKKINRKVKKIKS